MIRLLPSTDAQTIAVIPREFPTVDVSFDNISLTITEDGTNKSETITDIEATIPDSNSNFVYMDIAFSILSEENAYYLEFTKGALKALSARALKRGTGARGLRAIMESILLDVMYELPNLKNVAKVVVDEKVITENSKPQLVYGEKKAVKKTNVKKSPAKKKTSAKKTKKKAG